MKQKMKRTISFLLVLACALGLLTLSAFAAGDGPTAAPSAITQVDADYLRVGGRMVRYYTASDVVNAEGAPYIFNEQVSVPGLDHPVRALCAYHAGTLGSGANGQKWNFKNEVTHPSLVALLTWVYSCANRDFTAAGDAAALGGWGEGWTTVWFMVGQAMTWYYEYGILTDYHADREGFTKQVAEEFLAAFKMCHDTWNWAQWITDWDSADIHTIIDSADGGATGNSAYDFAAVAVRTVLDHPEYFHTYRLWEYQWDESQSWKLPGQHGTPMQRLLIAVPDKNREDRAPTLTIKKLEAGTNQPLPGVTFKVESVVDPSEFSVTRTTGADGAITLTSDADGLVSGQYTITEVSTPAGYLPQTGSDTVTVLPGSTAQSVFIYYNTPDSPAAGDGAIRKVDADNPSVGLPGAVIRITSIELDRGGSFSGTYTTGAGGYISSDDLDFASLPTGSYLAEEITPPRGYTLSSDPAKVRQTFVWDGEHDVNLVFEDDAKVKVQLKKVDESGNPLAGAVFTVWKDGQIIDTGVTNAAGILTVSNVSEGYYEFREVSAPAGYDRDPAPVGVYVNSADLQGEQIITVTKTNYHKRGLTIEKRDAETGAPVADTVFHVRGVNVAFEQDVTTGADGKAALSSLPSGCYEVEETNVPAPYILDTNNRRTVWVDAEQGTDAVVVFENSTRPGLRLLKLDQQTGEPLSGVLFRIAEVNGGYDEQHLTNAEGLIVLEGLNPGAYTVQEVQPKTGWVADDTVHTVYLEENKTTTLELSNLRKPDLCIKKVDSITGSPIEGVKFQVWRGSDDTKTGEYNDLGIFYTDAEGQISLERADTGWYKIQELEPAPGFTIKQPDTQEIYLTAGKDYTVTFENTPLNAIVVQKHDSVTGAALPGCTFQLRYFGGASGTEGTVIGQKVTGQNGTILWAGLQPGTYLVEEIDPADGYSILQSSETVFLADSGEQSVVTVRFENAPDGTLLIRKVCATNPSVTLQNAEFKIAYADGTLIGDSNGMFRSDENGEIRITGLKSGKSVVVTETRAPDGFILDTQSQTIEIKAGKTVSLTFKNQPKGAIIIQKRDSATGQPLPSAEFRVTTAAGCEVGLDGVIGTSTLTQNGIFTTDSSGEIRITNLAPGAYVLTEVKAPTGYVMDRASTNVVIGQGGDIQTVVIKNSKAGTLVIDKRDSLTGKPLEGVTFKVTTSTGEFVPAENGQISSNGLYFTDKDGKITINGVVGTLVVTETATISGYTINEATRTQTVVVNPNDTQTLYFTNTPSTTLVVEKYIEGTTTPLKGVTFLITDSSGAVVGNSNGEFITDENGRIVITDLAPGTTITAREVKTLEGYVLDATPKSILIKEGEVQTLTFYNTPAGGLELVKVNAADRSQRLSKAVFEIRCLDGTLVDTITTNSRGRVYLSLEAGSYYAVEVEAPEGFKLDDTPHYFTVEDGKTTTLTVTNKPFSGILLHKTDSVTGKGIPGVTFLLYDSGHNPIGQYTSDHRGYVYIEDLTRSGRYYLRELENEGYVPDPQLKTVYVTTGETTLVEWQNTPITAQIQITKKSADYNPTNGLPAGALLEGAVFELYDRAGNLVDTIRSDSRGLAVSRPLPLGRYTIREVKAPANYGVNDTELTAYLEHEGQIVRFEVANKSLSTSVSITKTGPHEIMAGQPVRYVFHGIANRSNVRLDSFYWRDTLPAEVRLDAVVTGTYNFPGTYKITYRVNGGEYRTLADNLSTAKNYTLAASPAALGLAANERVTEIMFVFGQAPAGFAQVEQPMLYCTAVSHIAAASFVNVADVGGVYNNQWVQAVSRWVTKVYGTPIPLPQTGF